MAPGANKRSPYVYLWMRPGLTRLSFITTPESRVTAGPGVPMARHRHGATVRAAYRGGHSPWTRRVRDVGAVGDLNGAVALDVHDG